MGIAAWGWDRNAVRLGRLTASSEVVGLGIGNLQNDHGAPSMGWQTVGTAASFTIDMGGAAPWRAFVLARTNLTAAATMRVRPYATPGGAVVSDSGILPAGVVPGIGQSIRLLPAEMTAQLCSIDLADPGNTDGFLNVPLAYAGPLTQTALNIGWGGGVGRTQGGQERRSRSGASFPRLDWAARTQEIEHSALLGSEVWPFVMALDLYARRGGNVLFVPDPDSPWLTWEAIFGRLTPTSNVTYPYSTDERRAWRATIEERL